MATVTVTVTGIVTANADPAQAGRIKCALACVDGQEFPEWLEPVFPPGTFFPPEIGEEVEIEIPEGEDLIEFPHAGRYRGVVHDDSHPPPSDLKSPTKKVTRRALYSAAGHRLIFDDNDGEKRVRLIEGEGGNELRLEKTQAHINAPKTLLSDVCTDKVLKGTRSMPRWTSSSRRLQRMLLQSSQ